jgi:hypothetical protein
MALIEEIMMSRVLGHEVLTYITAFVVSGAEMDVI